MKVMEIIERLRSEYNPDDHLYVEWWDKASVEQFSGGEVFLTDDEWAKVVTEISNSPGDQSGVASALVELAEEVIRGDR